jgi:guanylate kinase
MAAGLLLVLSGPSGVGKTTIAHELLRRFGGHFSVSATTRAPTHDEKDGVDYQFVTPEIFQRMIDQKQFIEYIQVFGRSWYGTPRQPVDESLSRGELVVLDIDVQGAEVVHAQYPGMLGIFILPPSDDSLLERLRRRGREDELAIQQRYQKAAWEMERARRNGIYDAFVVNDDLAAATEEVADLVAARLGVPADGGPRPSRSS